MQDCIRLQEGGTWSRHLKMEHLVEKSMVGPCGLGRAMCGELRISRSMGSEVWVGREEQRRSNMGIQSSLN